MIAMLVLKLQISLKFCLRLTWYLF